MRWLALTALVGCARPAPECTAFLHVNLLPLDDDRVIADQTIVVRDGKIASIGQTAPAGARIIDGSGKYLLPGLADMHTHLAREADLVLFVARGVTTVRNMWGAPMHLEWKKRIAKGELLGPTIYTPGPIVDGSEPEHDGSLVALTPEDADQVVRLHQQLGYDFIKIYSGLPAPVFSRLLQAAQAAKLPVAGHVPRTVGLWAAAEAGMNSFEHLSGLADALQTDDSPVRDKFDRASRRQKLEHLDPKKLPLLAQKLREQNLWSCPTRTVKVAFGLDAAQTRERLARPEMRYVPACDRAVWEPGPDDPAALERGRSGIALDDEAIGKLHEAGARLLAGTDTMNPLVVSGFSLHEELRLLAADGLNPREVLRIATHDAAEYLHREDEFGSLKVGQRADLLLLDANPLADLANSERIAGVMLRGRWLPASELDKLLAQVAADVDGKQRAFPGELAADGEREQYLRYDTTWRDAWFGGERVLVEKKNGRRWIHAQSFDPHEGQRVELRSDGQRLLLDSDGAIGRGRLELTRAGSHAHLQGQLLSGVPGAGDEEIAPEAIVGVENSLLAWFLAAPRLAALKEGESLRLPRSEVALGSSMRVQSGMLEVTRTDGHFEIKGGGVLVTDANGFPVSLELPLYGATVKIKRVE